jgi:hypothetical protein
MHITVFFVLIFEITFDMKHNEQQRNLFKVKSA